MNLKNVIQIFFGDHARAADYRLIALLALALGLAFLWSLVWGRSWDPNATVNRSFKGRLLRRAIVLLLVATCIHLQVNTIIKERSFKLMEDTLYLPNSRTVSIVSLGYQEMLADILFLRSIQAYGGGWQFSGRGGRPKLFEHYFNVITDLDPSFTKAYTFGNLLIGEEMRAPAPALGLLNKGTLLNPKSYRVSYEAGFFAVDRLADYERGAHYLRWAIQAPDVPDWVQRQIYYFKIRGGDYRYGFERYLRLLLDSRAKKNWIEEMIAKGRLISTTDDWGLGIIKKALEKHKDSNAGVYPPNLQTLERDGYFEPWEVANGSMLFRETAEGDTLLDMIPVGLSLEEQVAQIMDVITLKGTGIPPSADGRGWFYTRETPTKYRLEKLTESLQLSEEALFMQDRALKLELRATGMAPPTLRKLLESVSSNPDSALVRDPSGTFLLYNPETAEFGYMSRLVDQTMLP